MQYDIEADWYILEACDLGCYYCGIGPERTASELTVQASPLQWRQAFQATGKTWNLHLTGGEPGQYPGFVDLCEQLTQDNYVSINSNLASPIFLEFARRINPDRVHFFNAGLHYEMRRRPGMFEEFVEHALALKNAGFVVLISQVMTPLALRGYPDMVKRLDAYGLRAIPKVFRGDYGGRVYPEAWSAEEKSLLVEYMRETREWYQPVYANILEIPTVDLLEDQIFLAGVPNYNGSLCLAGSKFVSIKPDGSVFACNPPDLLGNLLSGNVRFLDGPKTCNTAYCGPYFCEKYIVERSPGSLQPAGSRSSPSWLKRRVGAYRAATANRYRRVRARQAAK